MEIWPKYGRTDSSHEKNEEDNADQRIHCDYLNHTQEHPPPINENEAGSFILFLSKVEDCEGATDVVQQSGNGDPAYTYLYFQIPAFETKEWRNNRKMAEAYLLEEAPEIAEFRTKHLYAREKRVLYTVGMVLFYRQDTWHRGTELKPVKVGQSHCRLDKHSAHWMGLGHDA